MKLKLNIKQTTIIATAIVSLAVPVVAHAEENTGSTSGRTSGEQSQITSKTTESTERATQLKKAEELAKQKRAAAEAEIKRAREQAQQKAAERKASAEKKLDDTKRKVCDKREGQINTIMNKMDTRRQSAFDRITKVSEAAQAFYTKKNLTVENYSTLLATVTSTKAAAEASMNDQKSVPTFSCGSDQPKTELQTFKDKRSASIAAMKAYREAVKELVKAVKSTAKASEAKTSTTQTGEQS